MAGGKSTRFGSDKRFAEFEGESLLVRACRIAAAAVSGRLIVSVGPEAMDLSLLSGFGDLEAVLDEPAGAGPLGGLAAGLSVCDAGVVVLAVDEPMVRTETLARLAALGSDRDAAAALKSEHGWEPLVAYYPKSILHDVRAAIDEGRRAPKILLERTGAIAVTDFDPAELSNVNTEAALDDLRSPAGNKKDD